jgi:uncharacterized damage-inducible protein DinB
MVVPLLGPRYGPVKSAPTPDATIGHLLKFRLDEEGFRGASYAGHALEERRRTRGSSVNANREREALAAWLRAQREHVLQAVGGLSDEALRRPVLPSGWTCLGLVQHLTIDVERFWFRAVVAGEDVHLETGAHAWHVAADVPAEEVLSAYRAEAEQSDMVIAAAVDLEAAPAWWPVEVFADLPVRDLRQTILHVMTETACHAGHLDAARELLDGHQHLVLT